jgi:hypothetical protein
MLEKPAVLVISYLRPINMYKTLLAAHSYGIRDFYVAIDGPKDSTSKEVERSFKEKLDKFQAENDCDLKVWVRERNLGLAPSMISAIDWFFENVDAGIVLEDDLEISKAFIDFMEISLKFYEKDRNVLMVSGNQFYNPFQRDASIYLSHYPLIWGWSTWSERWISFREAIISEKITVVNAELSRKVEYFWKLGSIRSLSTRLNSWAILLATYSRFNGLVCVSPGTNLTANNGADTHASHTLDSHWTLGVSIVEKIPADLSLLNKVNIDKFLEESVFEVKKKHWFLILKIVGIKTRDMIKPPVKLLEAMKNIEYPGMKNPYGK